MSADATFTEENLDFYLKELAKDFRKRNGRRTPAEIILVGGAAILVNYGFREMTTDIDAIIQASSAMRESIHCIGDRYGLPEGWINADFMRTDSYSRALVQHSKYYKTYANILEIRTVCAEYLLAMKLVSARRYKNDMSDIIGIIKEERARGNELTFEQVDQAVTDLYGSWDRIDEKIKVLLKKALEMEDLEELYQEQREKEIQTREVVKEIGERYPERMTVDQLNDIIDIMMKKKQEAEHERKGTL